MVAAPMSLASWALYYNKQLLAKYGIKSPPTTLAQLQADQAKMWVSSNGQVSQIGFYPDTNENGFGFYTSFFGRHQLHQRRPASMTTRVPRRVPGGIAEMNWPQELLPSYSYSQVMALQTAMGQVAGGAGDIFSNGKSGFVLSGPWEGAQRSRPDGYGARGPLQRRALPPIWRPQHSRVRATSTLSGRAPKHPKQAIEFIAWLSGL